MIQLMPTKQNHLRGLCTGKQAMDLRRRSHTMLDYRSLAAEFRNSVINYGSLFIK